jgi:aminoglycoside phosphotransferase (APT) family kinase protein
LNETETAALARWLDVRLGPPLGGIGHLVISDVEPLSTGFSAETISLRASWSSDDPEEWRLVLRRESPDPAVYPQQAPGVDVEVDIQYRVMSALLDYSAVPVAPTVGYEADPSVLGAPFFVMEFVEGQVPLVTPSYAESGFFAEAAPGDRRAMIENGIEVLASLHAVDWEAAGLEWLLGGGTDASVERQLAIWRRYSERELGGRRHPLMARAFEWLAARPPEAGSSTLNWGDPRPGNMIWRDFRCVCVTDFEAASIAPAEVDLGWWLMFDRWSHESAGVARLEGEPTREEQADLYRRLSGREVADLHWYEVFAALRYCAIVVRVMNRTVERGLMPADNSVWLENQATVCLEQLLG